MATSISNVATAASSLLLPTLTSTHSPSSSASTSGSSNPQLNGPSVTLFAYVFVAVALTAVFLAGAWRCYRLTQTGDTFFPDIVFRDDPFVYGFGYYGFGAPSYDWARLQRGKNVGLRPKIVEVLLGLDEDGRAREKGLEIGSVEPLCLIIPSSKPSCSSTQSPPHLHLSFLILPPSQTPLQPLQRYPNGMEDTEVDLPELFFGTLAIDVNLGADYWSRGEWEELRRKIRREEMEWGKRMEAEEE